VAFWSRGPPQLVFPPRRASQSAQGAEGNQQCHGKVVKIPDNSRNLTHFGQRKGQGSIKSPGRYCDKEKRRMKLPCGAVNFVMYQCFTLGEWNLLDTTLETRHRIVSSSLEIPTSFCRNPLAEGMDHIELHLRSRAEMDVLDHATDLDETSGRRGIVYSCGRRSKEGNKLTEPRVPAQFKCLDAVDVPMVLAIGFNPQRQVLKIRRV